MTAEDAGSDYLELLKRVLTRDGFEEEVLRPVSLPTTVDRALARLLRFRLRDRNVRMVEAVPVDPASRRSGGDAGGSGETMIGRTRLDNLQRCIETALREGVPGDLIETGVWRGGACIFMRAVLRAHGVTDRTVWVADSFKGLPPPDATRYPADAGDDHWTRDELAVGELDVRRNFERYGLLDDQVRFLPGWFRDTLPAAPIEQIAVARLDGDMYGSTMEALEALYDRVSPGGFVIVDDYGAVAGCRQATEDFRRERGITEQLHQVDWTAVYWRRSA